MVNGSKVVGVVMTLAVISLLVLVGPAEAFSLGIDRPDGSPFQEGEIVTTTAVVNVNADEILKTNAELTLRIDGPGPNNDRICIFKADGTIVSGCQDLTITLKSKTAGYGYGYIIGNGYGYGLTDGKLIYEIKIDTDGFRNGNYFLKLTSLGFKSKPKKFVVVQSQPDTPTEDQVTLCHKGKQTMTLPASAAQAHLAHGDTLGACPA